MQQQKLASRVDAAELKGLIVKRLGADRSRLYFYYLNRLLSQKVSKSEFDKLCQRVMGRENLPLHNQLIRAILKNACTAESPLEEGVAKMVTEAGQRHGGSQFGVPGRSAVTWSNGVASPRKIRLDNNHDCVFRNRHSLAENEKDKEKSPQQLLRRQFLSRSVEGLVSLYRKDKEGEQSGRLKYSPIRAPLGVPTCSASIGGSRKAFTVTSSDTDTHLRFCCNGELSDTETLRIRMERIAALRDLGGVSLECANLLNKVLDVYLKRLIKLCMDLVEAKSGNESRSSSVSVHQKPLLMQGKYLNGLLLNNQLHAAASEGRARTMCEEKPHPAISLLDFKVAMELNPQQLGEDWPLNFEKICMYSFEEE